MTDIIFTGGGTAGHVTPNLALFPELQAQGYQLAYIGQAGSIEHTLVSKAGIEFFPISAGKLRRYFDWQNFTDVFRILLGLFQALGHLLRHRPKLVFSKGGFVSCPVVWAAWLLRIPVIIHESDLSPGLANKLSAPFASKVCYSFPETAAYLPQAKALYTGLPVRNFLLNGNAQAGYALCGFSNNKPMLLVIGGSLGAKNLNHLVRENLDTLLTSFNVCHICGAGAIDTQLSSVAGYAQFEYVDQELADIFAACELVLSRAGATSIFEFLALRLPALLVPLSLNASRGDQILNAQSFEKQGYAMQVDEQVLLENPVLLNQLLQTCFAQKSGLIAKMVQSKANMAGPTLISLIKEYL